MDGADITLASVTLHTPNYDRILVKGLSVTVKPGEGLMIVGESGSGRSSLLRAIAGLWRSGTGTIYRRRKTTSCSCRSNRTCCWAPCAASYCTRTTARRSPVRN